MSAHRILADLFKARYRGDDPGASGTIVRRRWFELIPIVTVAAETRLLGAPIKEGEIVVLQMQTDGGDCVVTVTGGYDELGSTSFTLSDPGQFGVFMSINDAGSYVWRLISSHTLAGLAAADEVVTAVKIVTAAESGKTFFLALAAGFSVTLPAPALGLKYRFIVGIAPTGATYAIGTNGSANIMYGKTVERAGGAGVAGAARDTFNFVNSQAIISDFVEFRCDGTNWHYFGMVDVAAGNTVAQT